MLGVGGCELFPGGHALCAGVRDTVCREGCAPFIKELSLAAASHCLCGTFGPVPCGEGPVPPRLAPKRKPRAKKGFVRHREPPLPPPRVPPQDITGVAPN